MKASNARLTWQPGKVTLLFLLGASRTTYIFTLRTTAGRATRLDVATVWARPLEPRRAGRRTREKEDMATIEVEEFAREEKFLVGEEVREGEEGGRSRGG